MARHRQTKEIPFSSNFNQTVRLGELNPKVHVVVRVVMIFEFQLVHV